VSRYGDDLGEMPTQRLLDDASVEAVLEGRLVPSELAELASVVGVLRETASRPVQPSFELAAFMAAGGLAPLDLQQPSRWRVASSKLAGMSMRLKLAAGVAAGITGLTGAAAAAGELPPPVQESVEIAVEAVVDGAVVTVEVAANGVEAAVEFVTPIEFPDERVSSKGHIEQPGKPAVLTKDTEVADQPPYAVDAEVPPAIASPTPSPSPTLEVPAVPPAAPPEPTTESTPTPTPEATASSESTPTPEPTPTPTPTPSEAPPPPPPPPDQSGDGAQAAASVAGESDSTLVGDSLAAPVDASASAGGGAASSQ
jgi:hypothetical protein